MAATRKTTKRTTKKTAKAKPALTAKKKTTTKKAVAARKSPSAKKSPSVKKLLPAKKSPTAKKSPPAKKTTAPEKTVAKRTAAGAKPLTVDRRGDFGRRTTAERRKQHELVNVQRRKAARRKVPRRRQIDPTTCERDYTGEEIEFMNAMDKYKRTSGRMFPTCSEVLEVIRNLGYQRPQPGESPDPSVAPPVPAPPAEQVSHSVSV